MGTRVGRVRSDAEPPDRVAPNKETQLLWDIAPLIASDPKRSELRELVCGYCCEKYVREPWVRDEDGEHVVPDGAYAYYELSTAELVCIEFGVSPNDFDALSIDAQLVLVRMKIAERADELQLVHDAETKAAAASAIEALSDKQRSILDAGVALHAAGRLQFSLPELVRQSPFSDSTIRKASAGLQDAGVLELVPGRLLRVTSAVREVLRNERKMN